MNENKLITLVTKNALFAMGYIVIFIGVAFTAMITGGNPFWVKASWSMLSLLGIFVSIGAYVSHQEASQSKRWPTVSAKLLSTRVSSGLATGNQHTYSPVAEYEFSYMGKKYRGNTIDYSAASGSQAWAQKVIDQLQQRGIALVVSVNPENPEMNVLNPGVRLVHYMRYLIGPAMIVIGLLGVQEIIKI